jgi:hypothetical protein
VDDARALVALARAGLEARVAAGLEPESAVELLAPLERRAAAGISPAVDLERVFAREGSHGLASSLRYDARTFEAAERRAA